MRRMKDSGIKWVGMIPASWNVYPIYMDFEERKNQNYKLQEQNLLSLSYGRIIRKNIKENGGLLPTSFDTYNIVEDGDIIIRPTDLQNDKKSLRTGLVQERGIITSAYIALKPKKGVNSEFFHYLLYAYDILKVFYNMGNGVRQGLNYNEFAKLLLVAPLPLEQNKIVLFLDKKCADIDALAADIQAEIDALESYKKSIITKTVTQGLEKNVPMKDSGVDWIPYKIPLHWNIKKIKHLFQLRDERNYKPLSEVNLISLYTNLGVVQHSDLKKTTGNKAQNADGYKKVYANDIIVNIILCWMGAIGISKYNGVTSPAYDVYKSSDKNTCPQYYHYLFQVEQFHGKCYCVGRGIMAMRWRTYSSEFKNIFFPAQQLNQQKKILNYIYSLFT